MGSDANTVQVHGQYGEVRETTKEELSQGDALDLTEYFVRDISEKAAASKKATDTVLATIREASGTGGDTANRMNIFLGF